MNERNASVLKLEWNGRKSVAKCKVLLISVGIYKL